MAQVLMTIEEYIVEVRKKDTIFIGFNPLYAKAWMRFEMNDYEREHWLDKENVNWEKREEFLQFMAQEMPHILLTDVFDNVPLTWELWPFLGTIAIDIEAGGPEEDILNKHYEDENGEPYSLDAVVYIMKYDDALKAYETRKALEDEEDE